MFTASNGLTVSTRETGNELIIAGDMRALHLSSEKTTALREFFRHQEDERLQRWRTPRFPGHIVHVHEGGLYVWVSREVGGMEWVDAGDRRPYEFVRAASAYFDAHPARKPLLLQAQEDGTDEWFTIRTYPGDPGDRAHADASAHLLTSQDVPARVIEGDTP